jgi:prepilin-type N-terminal cleavage/methylation domain-containing protein
MMPDMRTTCRYSTVNRASRRFSIFDFRFSILGGSAFRVPHSVRRAFTLVELLVAIAIIGILASLFLAALAVSAERAREARTRTLIAKLDRAIMTRWESYRTRRVPILSGGGITPQQAAAIRLATLRELMRLEMPQRYSDISDDTSDPPNATPATTCMLTSSVAGQNPTALSQNYLRIIRNQMTVDNSDYEAAECLYLIVTAGGLEDDPLGEDHFRHEDVGDVNGNGMPEFVDGWGNPIRFLRWAPAFISDLQPDPATFPDATTFSRDYHDPFDPARIDMPGATITMPAVTFSLAAAPTGFRLFPLIYSAGPDGIYDISVTGTAALDYSNPQTYFSFYQSGIGLAEDSSDNYSRTAEDRDGVLDGQNDSFDNIHNHTLGNAVR